MVRSRPLIAMCHQNLVTSYCYKLKILTVTGLFVSMSSILCKR